MALPSSHTSDNKPTKPTPRGSTGGQAVKSRKPKSGKLKSGKPTSGKPSTNEPGDKPDEQSGPQSGESAEETPAATNQGVRGAQLFSADQFDEALLAANQASEEQAAFAGSEDDEAHVAAEQKTYDAFAKLAQITTYLDLQDFAQRSRTKKLEESLRTVAKSPEQRRPLLRASAKSLADPVSHTATA